MNNSWIKISDSLPESGQEVLTYYYDEGDEIDHIGITTYFRKGDTMDTEVSQIVGSDKERLLDTLFNPANEVKASQDGFYIYDSAKSEKAMFRKHADVITHWMPLPEPPK